MKILRECVLDLDFFVNDEDGNPRLVHMHIPQAEVEFENEIYAATGRGHNEGDFIKTIDIKKWDKIEFHMGEER